MITRIEDFTALSALLFIGKRYHLPTPVYLALFSQNKLCGTLYGYHYFGEHAGYLVGDASLFDF